MTPSPGTDPRDSASRLVYAHLDGHGGLRLFGPFDSVETAFGWACEQFGFVDSADGWISPLESPLTPITRSREEGT